MKKVLLALVTLTATSAFAGSHCPPGQNNVWGACINQGAGVFNHEADYGYRPVKAKKGCATTRKNRVVRTNPESQWPHWNTNACPPPRINVWGNCVDRADWGRYTPWGR